jgi:hypothetical protein
VPKAAEPAPRKPVAVQPVITSKFVIKKKNECVNLMDTLLGTYFGKKAE